MGLVEDTSARGEEREEGEGKGEEKDMQMRNR
jgi:hypothetical protein